ncbi:hypothetical protein F5884DRAFT_802735 [Xylogone sp. PMI_703]|nr:hypothetical protein F5884DRAFT_802735 [Xylogone sp. PMI_703]
MLTHVTQMSAEPSVPSGPNTNFSHDKYYLDGWPLVRININKWPAFTKDRDAGGLLARKYIGFLAQSTVLVKQAHAAWVSGGADTRNNFPLRAITANMQYYIDLSAAELGDFRGKAGDNARSRGVVNEWNATIEKARAAMKKLLEEMPEHQTPNQHYNESMVALLIQQLLHTQSGGETVESLGK